MQRYFPFLAVLALVAGISYTLVTWDYRGLPFGALGALLVAAFAVATEKPK